MRVRRRSPSLKGRVKRKRDAEGTRERLLSALARILLRDGLAAVGINSLAREAGCDKVLIYRYFGDLDGVYGAFAESRDFWWTVAEMTAGLGANSSVRDMLKTLLRRHAVAIRARPVTLAVLAAETAERTPLVIALESVRERRALELSEWVGAKLKLPPRVDLAAIVLLISSALTYLAVRAGKIRVMSGVLIRSDEDWRRLLAACDALVDGVVA